MRPIDRERGQIILLVALMLPMLLGMAGLVHDVGALFMARRAAQSAADAAAVAAAIDISRGNGPAAATASALFYAAQNGFNNDGVSNTVTVSIPPAIGTFAGNGNYAQVKIVTTPQILFAQILRVGPQQVSGLGTAGTAGAVAPYSLLALSTTACPGLSKSSSGSATAGGAVMVNSGCSSGNGAFNMSSSGSFSAPWIGVAGTFRKSGSGSVTPNPTTGVAAIADPLASVPPPSFAGLNPQGPGTASDPKPLTTNSSVTLDPGIYYGGINIGGSANLTLNPGIYVIAGGGFSYQASGSLSGNGVLIYNTQDPSHPSGSGAYGPTVIAGSANSGLSPMSSGTYKNLLFFQDRNNTQPFNYSASKGMQLQGSIYAPSSPITLSGAGTSVPMQLIGSTISVTGSGVVYVSYDGNLFYGIQSAALVE